MVKKEVEMMYSENENLRKWQINELNEWVSAVTFAPADKLYQMLYSVTDSHEFCCVVLGRVLKILEIEEEVKI
jgi:hypothetical protein